MCFFITIKYVIHATSFIIVVVIFEGVPHGSLPLLMSRLFPHNNIWVGYVCLKDLGKVRDEFEREERAMRPPEVAMNERQLHHKLRFICNHEATHNVGWRTWIVYPQSSNTNWQNKQLVTRVLCPIIILHTWLYSCWMSDQGYTLACFRDHFRPKLAWLTIEERVATP